MTRVVCPCCHQAFELDDDFLALVDEVACPACKTPFRWKTTPQEGATMCVPCQPQRKLGRYQIVDTLGTGAFGAVFKGWDPRLGRFVAIKVPRTANAPTGKELDRLQREARSVAQLRHPAIVSIHEVGETDGIPYLVSEFVAGVTLADALAGERPLLQEALQTLINVAEALDYAHERGIIHRDVKPSNIMLGDDGQVRLMDFGLAKRDSGEDTMTVEGQPLGTPAYMSPEQARGEGHRVDRRSDVYSLGVILYQVLTNELPFRGNPRMLFQHVLYDDPPPPRSLNDRIAVELETICLKAMGKEPNLRYATAKALAEDLRRFTRGEPIVAQPLGLWGRGRLWRRRNPVVAALLVALAAALVGGLAGVIWQWERAEEQRQVAANLYDSAQLHLKDAERERLLAQHHLEDAENQRRRADESFTKARRMAEEYLRLVSDSQLLQATGLQPLRQELLQSALSYYDDVLTQRKDDPALRAEVAAAYLRCGGIIELIGARDKALALFQRARGLLEQLANDTPTGTILEQGAECCNRIGKLNAAAERWETALKDYQQAVALRQQLVRDFPGQSGFCIGLGAAWQDLGRVQLAAKQPKEALASLQAAKAQFDRAAQDHQVNQESETLLGLVCGDTSDALMALERPAEALTCADESVAHHRGAFLKTPESAQQRRNYGRACAQRARVLAALNRFADALSGYQEALKVCRQELEQAQKLLAAAPQDAAAQRRVNDCLIGLAGVLAQNIPLVATGTGPMNNDDRNTADRFAEEALDALRQAIGAGFNDFDRLKKEPDLAPLRSRADFQKILREMHGTN